MTKKFFFIFSFFCFFSFSFVNVHAETYTPKSITYNFSNGSPTDAIRYKVLDNIPVYYYSYGGQTWTSSISFNYSNFSNNLMNKTLNFSGTFYTTSRTDSLSQPYRVWVIDNNTNTTYACSTQSSGQSTVRGSTSFWNTFTCSNVVITFSDFRIYVGSNFYSDGEIGISKINIQQSELSDISNTNKDINNSIKDTNNTLKDDSIDDNVNISQDDLTDESGLQDLLLMPLTLMNAVNTGFNSSCSTFSLGSLFGHNLSLKCFTISDVIGSNLAGIIDVIISGIFIYLFSKHLRKIFDRTTNLENEEGDVI